MTKCVNCAKEMEKGSGESILSDVGLLCKECYAEREGLTIEEVEKQKKEQANTLKKEPQGIIDKLMNQPSFIDLLSLTIEDVDSAKKAARLGLYASMFVSAFGIIWIVFKQPELIAEYGYGVFIDSLVFALIAWGIYKMSRTASVLGLLFYLFQQIVAYPSFGFEFKVRRIMMPAILILMFINSIRGTFAFHKYKSESINKF